VEILLTIVYTVLFLFIIWKTPFFQIEGLNKKALPVVFILKIAAGILMFLVYTYYYTDRSTADIFKYFDDSKVMYNALFTHPLDYFQMLFGVDNDSPHFDIYYHQMNNWYRLYESNLYNDSHTMIRLNALLRLFSFGYYNVHTVFVCFLSLAGLTGIYKFFMLHLSDKKNILFVAVFMLPSVLFWGSGVLKETLLFFGLGMLLFYSDKIFTKGFSLLSLFWILIALILLMFLKFYILATILPLMITYFWVYKTKMRWVAVRYAIVILVCLIAGLNIHYIFPEHNLLETLTNKQFDFIRLANATNSGSTIEISTLQPTTWSFIIHSPEALYNTLFRPFVFESRSPFILLAGLENLLIIFMMMICIIFSKFKKENANLFWFCLLFVLITFVLTGLITPVMGAIVRYKVPALPFLFVMFIVILDKQKLVNKFSFLKKYL